MSDERAILTAIENFHPARSSRQATGEEWLELDELVQELAGIEATPESAARALLGVFERFPGHDGHEVFWGLLHYLEGVPGYERLLIESVQRAPNHMSVVMLRRLMNSGVVLLHGVDLPVLLSQAERLVPDVDFTVGTSALAAR